MQRPLCQCLSVFLAHACTHTRVHTAHPQESPRPRTCLTAGSHTLLTPRAAQGQSPEQPLGISRLRFSWGRLCPARMICGPHYRSDALFEKPLISLGTFINYSFYKKLKCFSETGAEVCCAKLYKKSDDDGNLLRASPGKVPDTHCHPLSWRALPSASMSGVSTWVLPGMVNLWSRLRTPSSGSRRPVIKLTAKLRWPLLCGSPSSTCHICSSYRPVGDCPHSPDEETEAQRKFQAQGA